MEYISYAQSLLTKATRAVQIAAFENNFPANPIGSSLAPALTCEIIPERTKNCLMDGVFSAHHSYLTVIDTL